MSRKIFYLSTINLHHVKDDRDTIICITGSFLCTHCYYFIKKGKNLRTLLFIYQKQNCKLEDLKKYNKVCGFDHTLIVPATYIHTFVFPMHTLLLSQPEVLIHYRVSTFCKFHKTNQAAVCWGRIFCYGKIWKPYCT